MLSNKLATIFVVGFFSVLPQGLATAADEPEEWSRTQPYPIHDVYYPGTEAIAPEEILYG